VTDPALNTDLGESYAADKEDMRFNEALKRGRAAQASVAAEEPSIIESREEKISERPLGAGEAIGNVASDIIRGIPEIFTKGAAGAIGTITADPIDLMADIVGASGADATALENAATATREFIESATAGPPDTVTGEIAEDMGSFLSAFIPIMGQLGKAGQVTTKVGQINKAATSGMLADFLTTDTPDEEGLRERLSMVKFGALSGLAIDKAVDYLRAVRVARHARRKKQGKVGGGRALDPLEGQPQVKGEEVRLTEDQSAPLTRKKSVDPSDRKQTSLAEQRLKKAENEVNQRLGPDADPAEVRRIAANEATEIEINFDRINTIEDVERLMQDTTDLFTDSVKRSGQEPVSNVATEEAADLLGLSLEDVLSRRKGVALNAKESVAFRKVWVAAGDRLGQLAEAAAHPNAGATDQIKFRKMLSIFHLDLSRCEQAGSRCSR